MGDGMGKELEPEVLVQNLLCSVGNTPPEWDLKLVSKSLSKDSLQPECSIVSLTARCRPPPTRRTQDLQACEDLTAPNFPEGEQDSSGCHVAHNQLLSLPPPTATRFVDTQPYSPSPNIWLRAGVGENQHRTNGGSSGLRRKCASD